MRTLFFLFFSITIALPARGAELYKCGPNTYTNIKKEDSSCSKVPTLMLCSNDGNRYFTPGGRGDKRYKNDATCKTSITQKIKDSTPSLPTIPLPGIDLLKKLSPKSSQ